MKRLTAEEAREAARKNTIDAYRKAEETAERGTAEEAREAIYNYIITADKNRMLKYMF